MNNKYNDLFDELVKSYYEGNFDTTLSRIMVSHEASPQETFKIITSLCGVDIKFDNNYMHNLKKAITTYSVNKRIVEKMDCCAAPCSKNKDDKYSCEAACPFEAIKYDNDDEKTYIDPELCMNCGLCVDACKSGRILDKVEYIPIADLIKNHKTVVAIVAPSIIGQFGSDVTMDMLREAFINIGFSDMIEVAISADILSIKESVEFDEHVKDKDDFMLTSCCCPMWVGMIKRVYHELVPELSPSASPMVVTGRIVKKLNPEAKVVFIGPCIAKKAEAKEPEFKDTIDFVLTYAELDEIFNTLDIDLSSLKGIPTKEYASKGGRLYGRSGGICISISEILEELYPEKHKLFKPLKASGVKECKEILNKALDGKIDGNFIEGMGCTGGCVGGPKALIPTEAGKEELDELAFNSAIKVPLHSETLDRILKKLDITSVDDFKIHDKAAILERKF
ncbi:MAG: [Fe-Fe] hydrogenase large subunit C-terminal domain-containing protein [Clostridium sp.]|nr:[Fe-Fe] hydrogenase large subunit C-terminal domain-containing protein [Clostridium sp.]